MCMQGFIKGRCGMCVYAGFHKGEVWHVCVCRVS